MRIDNGLAVKVKNNVEVDLQGIRQGQDNPNTLEVHKGETYLLYYVDFYSKDGTCINELYNLEDDIWLEMDSLGFVIESVNGSNVTIRDKDGVVNEYSIIPNEYRFKGNLSEELENGQYIDLLMGNNDLGDSDDEKCNYIHDLNVAYSVFDKYFEIVGVC